jgi:UDP-glucuronate 4-epimerase
MIALVTGCAGFIGSHLCESLLADGNSVVGVDALTETYSAAQKNRHLEIPRHYDAFSLHRHDLAAGDQATLRNIVADTDTIFHLAGEPGVRASWGAGFDSYVRNNIIATQELLEAIQATDATPRVVLASSSSVYGDAESYPTPETTEPRPKSPYGVTKLAAEHLCRAYRMNSGLALVILRYFSVFGPRQRPDMAFYRFIVQAMAGEPISVYGDGRQSRDFTFVSDVVAATRSAASVDSAVGRVFNVGGGRRTSVNDVLDVLAGIVPRQLHVIQGPSQPGDARDTCADIGQARDCLGFAPRIGLNQGLREEFEWLRSSA